MFNKKKEKDKLVSTQIYLDIGEIKNDTLVLKEGSLRAILEVEALNFNLKSEEEQNSIIYSFRTFLNSLDFPIQILMQSRKMDMENHIKSLTKLIAQQTNHLLREQMIDYVDYISRLLDLVDVMDKKFYLIVPYNPPSVTELTFYAKFFKDIDPRDTVSNIKKRYQIFEKYSSVLKIRTSQVMSALEEEGLKTKRLKTEEIIDIFYKSYNLLDSHFQKINDLSKINLERDI